jgi:glucan 1,3-beta-glucosidase
MTDLTFNGGLYGAFVGNQQFTTRNLVFNDVQTAVFMNWNWAWTFKSLSINNCGIGIDMANGGSSQQTVGSVLVLDGSISNTPIGIRTAFNSGSQPDTGGTLIIDNTDFTGSAMAVADPGGSCILPGNTKIASWGQGSQYLPSASGSRFQGPLTPPSKPASLLDAEGLIYERSRPQYQDYDDSHFVSVKSHGAKGDGATDDTIAIQEVINAAKADEIVYFDSGAYVISQTIKIPKNIRITGEIWPLILASGPAFQDESNPTPVFQIGTQGDEGAVEISDLIFQTVGPQPGAVLVEWNVRDPLGQQGASGMWDVHFRIGGAAGTQLQSAQCAKNPSVEASAALECRASFLLLHVTQQASIYLENNWFWVADHELDLADHGQINIFNGRGVLIESAQGPIWM